MQYSFPPGASKLVNLPLKHERGAAARQFSRVHRCEHLSPMWTLAQMWHTGSGHMQAFHPSSPHWYWCCEYTSHDCWLWQHSDSHNPSQKIWPSSFSPGQARPSLHKTLIDLMDLRAVHTPSPNKQSAQDPSPLRQRGSARPPLSGQRRPAKLVSFSAGPRGRFEHAVRRFIILQIRTLPPPLPSFYSLPGQPELTQVHSRRFHDRSQERWQRTVMRSSEGGPLKSRCIIFIWTDLDGAHSKTSAKSEAPCVLNIQYLTLHSFKTSTGSSKNIFSAIKT